MTLTDFLLARIAEDEAIARHWPDDRAGVAPNGMMWVDGQGRPVYWPRPRVLAECEAKRRIIADHCGTANERTQYRPCSTLRALALPYVDHADFNPAWTAAA